VSGRGVFDDKITYRLTYKFSMNYKDIIISAAKDFSSTPSTSSTAEGPFKPFN